MATSSEKIVPVHPATNGRRLAEPILPAARSSPPLGDATPRRFLAAQARASSRPTGRRARPQPARGPAAWSQLPPSRIRPPQEREGGRGRGGRERAARRRGPNAAAASSSPSPVAPLSSRPRGQSSRPRRRATQAELESTPPQPGPGRSRLRAHGWRGRGRGAGSRAPGTASVLLPEQQRRRASHRPPRIRPTARIPCRVPGQAPPPTSGPTTSLRGASRGVTPGCHAAPSCPLGHRGGRERWRTTPRAVRKPRRAATCPLPR